MPKLGVNIDHVATIREARKVAEPDPVLAAKITQKAGADSIVAHLREDRRHIKDEDIKLIKENVRIKFNLEMAPVSEIINIARFIKPDQSTLVPEKREEITTEGGLNVEEAKSYLKDCVLSLKKAGIEVSLFIEPAPGQVRASKEIGADAIELHTGRYANSEGSKRADELEKLIEAANLGHVLGLKVHAGHGLNYENVKPVAEILFIEELNIGHSIISRAVFVGLENAVKEMLNIIKAQG